MATTTTITKLLFRRGNDADRKKTILASGEPGFALDTGRFFIGDGSTPGGHPIVQTGPWHINYIDEIGTVDGDYSRQFLDISVPGLSATLAGDAASKETHPDFLRDVPKLFHPTDRTLLSEFKLQLTGKNDPVPIIGDNGWPMTNGGASIEFSGESTKTFMINRSPDTPGKINIGDMIFMDTAAKILYLETDTFAVDAENQVFAGAENTLFEDGSIDLNTPIAMDSNDPEGLTALVAPPDDPKAVVATSEGVGLHFAHTGYLSAGGIFIKPGAQETENWNTMMIQPCVYHHDWVNDKPQLIERLKGQVSIDTATGDPIYTMPTVARFAEEINGTAVRGDVPSNGSASEAYTYTGQRGPTNWTTTGDDSDLFSNMQRNGVFYANAKPVEIRSVRPAGQFESAGLPTGRSAITSIYQNTGPISDKMLHADATKKYPGIDATNRGHGLDPWKGPAHLVFETGLIVLGPGDRDIQGSGGDDGLNGYLINQSLDSYAVPTFQGLNIEGPNSKPMQVKSGGTSRREHRGGWLLTGGLPNDQNSSIPIPSSGDNLFSEEPFNAIGCPLKVGNNPGLLMGTTKGAVVSGSLAMLPAEWHLPQMSSSYAHDTNSGANAAKGGGSIQFTSRFVPNGDTVGASWCMLNAGYDKRMFFDKWTYIKGDSGAAEPLRFDAGIQYVGDSNNMTTTVAQGTTPAQEVARPVTAGEGLQWQTGDGPVSTVTLKHTEHAAAGSDNLWTNKTSTIGSDAGYIRAGSAGVFDGGSSSRYTQESGGNGHVISRVDFNKAGHLRSIQFKDLDIRYPQIFHMGTLGRRSTVINSPGSNGVLNFTINSCSTTEINATMNRRGSGWSKKWLEITTNPPIDGAETVQIINNITFNDYGTVKSISTSDLKNTFYNKVEVADMMDNMAYDFEGHEIRLDNDFLRRNANSATTSGLTTDWLGKSRIRFSEGSSIRSQIWQDSSKNFRIQGEGDIYIDSGGGYADDVVIRYGTMNSAAFNTQAILYYNNARQLETNGSGILIHGSNDPRGSGGAGKVIQGTCNYAHYASTVYISERESNQWHSLTFTSDNAENRGYESLYKDNVLRYNASSNTLEARYYVGDGRHLDMSKNTTIPPTVELQTSGSAYYRVVGCTSDRHKIYDRDNTVKFHGTSGHLLAKGDIIAYYSFSDKRLKEKITTLDPEQSLNKVLALESVSFEWKHAPERGEQIGLIAQQVEEVVPQVVHEADRYSDNDQETKYKRVDYDKIVPLLVDSIKVLTARVEELEAKLEAK